MMSSKELKTSRSILMLMLRFLLTRKYLASPLTSLIARKVTHLLALQVC